MTPEEQKREETFGTGLRWGYAENIVWAIVFLAILLCLDGWAKAWALVPLLFLNIIDLKRS